MYLLCFVTGIFSFIILPHVYIFLFFLAIGFFLKVALCAVVVVEILVFYLIQNDHLSHLLWCSEIHSCSGEMCLFNLNLVSRLFFLCFLTVVVVGCWFFILPTIFHMRFICKVNGWIIVDVRSFVTLTWSTMENWNNISNKLLKCSRASRVLSLFRSRSSVAI